MAVEIGSFSKGSVGNATVLLNSGSTPVGVEFWVANRAATNETDIRWSRGFMDGTNQFAQATFNSTADGTRSTTSKCIMHYIDVSGTATLKVQGTFVSFGAGQFVVNMDTVDANYSIFFIAYF